MYGLGRPYLYMSQYGMCEQAGSSVLVRIKGNKEMSSEQCAICLCDLSTWGVSREQFAGVIWAHEQWEVWNLLVWSEHMRSEQGAICRCDLSTWVSREQFAGVIWAHKQWAVCSGDLEHEQWAVCNLLVWSEPRNSEQCAVATWAVSRNVQSEEQGWHKVMTDSTLGWGLKGEIRKVQIILLIKITVFNHIKFGAWAFSNLANLNALYRSLKTPHTY